MWKLDTDINIITYTKDKGDRMKILIGVLIYLILGLFFYSWFVIGDDDD